MNFRTDILSHRDRLYRLALNITTDAAEAEDVVQDVMLRAWERRAEWGQVENMQAWLMQICKRQALDRLKHMTLIQSSSLSDEMLAGTKLQMSGERSSEVEARETYRLLQQLITELPPPLDDLVRLRDIEGMSYRDIALQLSLSEDQVRVYLHRARGKIRERYLKLQHFGL